jgi:hypothetical protein
LLSTGPPRRAEPRAARRAARSVHSANKLASKHTRVPFLGSPGGVKAERPCCDICQTVRHPRRRAAHGARAAVRLVAPLFRRAGAPARAAFRCEPLEGVSTLWFLDAHLTPPRRAVRLLPPRLLQAKALFVCREDRAYLCRACDFAVHSSNEAAGTHERWFLNTSRVALAARPDEPSQPLGRAAAVKAAAAARAAAAAASAAACATVSAPARPKPALAPQQPMMQAPAAAAVSSLLLREAADRGVQRVPSFNSLDVSLGMGDLLSFEKARHHTNAQKRKNAKPRATVASRTPPPGNQHTR